MEFPLFFRRPRARRDPLLKLLDQEQVPQRAREYFSQSALNDSHLPSLFNSAGAATSAATSGAGSSLLNVGLPAVVSIFGIAVGAALL